MEQENNSFLNENKSLLLDEIKGLIIQTSRAMATAQREIKINGINVKNRDTYPIANFYYHFNNLYILTRDLITEIELKNKIYNWLNFEFYYQTDSKKVVELFSKGMELFNLLDSHLYKIGIKDTNKTSTCRFPFDYYMRLIKDE